MEFKPLENERWVWCKTFKDDYSHYLVSDMGRCWNCKTKKFVGYPVKRGEQWYFDVKLSKSRKETESMMIGRLILISFGIPIPEHLKDLPTSKLQAMHLDGNSTNNNLSNFAWGDHSENANEVNCKIRKGKSVLQYSKNGSFIREWICMGDVEREIGIRESKICLCCNGKRKSAGGYIWKYKKEVA